MRILIINGPNLNLLGRREPEIYGSETLQTLERRWLKHGSRVRVGISTFQSNHEGTIIDAIHGAAGRVDGIILNAGAFTHYSYAIYDALVSTGIPTVEVHISNIHEREMWRRTSVISDAAIATIYGRGTVGYVNAIDLLTAHITVPHESFSYGPLDDQILDLRTPERNDTAPTAILIHGGFWRDVWKRDIMAPLSAALTQLGWATVNVEYTRGPGSFPQAIDDIGNAVDWVRNNAEFHRLDGDRIAVVGHSAGGYLALKAAHGDPGLAGVVALSPVTDLRAITRVRPDDDPVEAFIGCAFETDPAIWGKAALAGSPLVPVHLIHGALDPDVDPSHTNEYASAHDAVATAHVIDGIQHLDLIDPLEPGLDVIHSSLSELTQR